MLLLIVLVLFADIELFTLWLMQFDGNVADVADAAAVCVADDDDEDVVFTIFDAFESLSADDEVDDDVFVLLYLPNDVE